MPYLVPGDVPSGVYAEGVHGVGISVEAYVVRLFALLLPLRDMGMDTTQDMRPSGMGTRRQTRGTTRVHDFNSARHGVVPAVEDMVKF